MAYDDRVPPLWSDNPSLHWLNENPWAMPKGDMTLVAGTDSSKIGGLFLPSPNDSVVSMDSVYCRTSNPNDGTASLLKVPFGANKYEYDFSFNHFNFGGISFKISEHPEIENVITHGFSDWIVGKKTGLIIEPYPNASEYIMWTRCDVDVEFNSYGRDTDRAALVIYGKDVNEQWHVGGHADADGNIISSTTINGNSKQENPDFPLAIWTATSYLETDQIVDVVYHFVPLKPGQNKVPKEPPPAIMMLP